jgi:hypothetical protein
LLNQPTNMKNLIYTTITIFLSLSLTAQNGITMQMRGGYDFRKDIVISAAISFRHQGFAITPELIGHYKDDSPVEGGIKLSYEYKGVEAGYGLYGILYSTDKGTELNAKNGWGNNFFIQYSKTVLKQNWFLQVEYMKTARITLGVRGLISKHK